MPGSAGGRGRNPFHLTPLELLLQGYPGEFLPEPPEPGMASDRELMVACARIWLASTVLTDEEKERIQAVWIQGEYRSAHNLETGRRDELRGMMTRATA